MAECFEDNLQVCAGQSAEVSVSSQCDVMNPDDQTVGQQHVANGQIDSAVEHQGNMRIPNIRYGRIVFMAVATVLIAYMFLLAQFSLRASGGKGNLDRAKEYFHLWFQKTVFKHDWEDIPCR